MHGYKHNMFATISDECDLTSLRNAIVSQGLKNAISTSDPITVFGPVNKAFEKFVSSPTCGDLKQVLLYHVIPQFLPSKRLVNDTKYSTLRNDGKKVRVNVYKCPTFNNVITVNGSKVLEKNIYASNGVLYKINKVLCPPSGTIAQIVTNDPNFFILLTAVIKADLDSALNDPDSNLTVFAPTNEAFSHLLVELGITLQQLLDLPNLKDILLYHVLGQTIFSAAIKKGETNNIPTLDNGKTIDLNRKCKNIFIKDQQKRISKVISPNILAENGVIHAIDRVLLP